MTETEIKKEMTLEEFMQLPDEHIEFINGHIVQEPSPSYGHQKICANIAFEIQLQLKKNQSGEIVMAPMDVPIGGHVLQPDILFISKERMNIIIEGKLTDVPDVVFEIISPSNSFKDTKVKFDIYEEFGVKEYFIIYPDDKTVVKYALINGKLHEQYAKLG